MGDVVVTVKVNVADQSMLDSVLTHIKSRLHVSDARKEDIGFGIKVLKLAIMSTDAEGAPDVEEIINSIDGVSSVDVEGATRV
jgi:translation elongation factor EF-1beta